MKTLSTFDITAGSGNCRNSEGAFITLKDGRILFIYTRYRAGTGGDHDGADLAAFCSSDEGMSWQDQGLVVKKDDEAQNIMSVSLLRLKSGRILLFYLRKSNVSDGSMHCMPWCCWSDDEAASWSEPVSCLKSLAYYVVNNDRLIQLSDGRIAFAASLHTWRDEGDRRRYWPAMAFYCYSEDEGATWIASPQLIFPLNLPGTWSGWQEPGIIELAPHQLMMWFRTSLGCQYKTYSNDDGNTWSTPVPAVEFRGPCGPLSMKRDPEDGTLFAVWNDHYPRWGTALEWGYNDRRPLVIARSRDNGLTWPEAQMLENEPRHGYCYIAIHFYKDKLLLAYCCGLEAPGHNILMDTRIRVLAKEEQE